MNTEAKKHKLLAWVMWILTTAFFAYQFILRLSPGLIIHEIMSKFSIDASQYGMLSAMYYFGYSGMQIPVAILLDRFGPRIVGFLCAFICAISSLVFIYSDNWTLLLVCRFLIGVGSAAGFLNASKIVLIWFPPKLYGRMVGITFSLGLVGAVYGGNVSSLIEKFGWSKVMTWIGIAGFVISLLILFFVKNAPSSAISEDEHVVSKLKKICLNPKIIFMALANLMLVGSLEGFADVWGVPYLMKAFSYTKPEAAYIVYFIFIGMIVGAPLLTYIAEKSNMHYMITAFCGIGMATIFLLLISFQALIPREMLYPMMLLVGVFCCYQVLIFTISSMMVKPHLVGITIAFMNCINMLGGSFFHTVIGNSMDFFWRGQVEEGGIRVYDLESYNYALLCIPIAAIIGSLIFTVIKLQSGKTRFKHGADFHSPLE